MDFALYHASEITQSYQSERRGEGVVPKEGTVSPLTDG